LKLGNLVYPLKYQIIGGKYLYREGQHHASITVTSTSNGNLSFELPRNVIDSKKQGNQDANFVVFQDGQFGSASDQLKTDAQVRVLSISFDNGTEQIEIAGTQLGPAITPQVTTSTPTTINPANATKAPANVTAAKTSTNATSAKSSANVTTASKTTALSNPTTNLKRGSKMHPLNYRITGGGNKLSGVSLEKDSSTLLLSIS
jgi:hypothetical protein